MTHKFDDKWTVFETTGVNAPKAEPNPIVLVINEDGTVNPDKSHHGNSKLKGHASELALHLERLDTDTGNKRTFDGRLCEDCIVNDHNRVMVIVGKFTDTPLTPPTTNAQNEGVWVITKP